MAGLFALPLSSLSAPFSSPLSFAPGALRDPEQLGRWILKGRRRGRKMTLADVASVGAGRCAAGHLPAPRDPGVCALRQGPQRARPQRQQNTLDSPRNGARFLEGDVRSGRLPLSTSPPPPPFYCTSEVGRGWQVGGAVDRWLMVDGIFSSSPTTPPPLCN